MQLRLFTLLLAIFFVPSAFATNFRTGHPIISSTPLISLQNQNCSEEHKVDLLDDTGGKIARICQGTFELCSIEGSCVVDYGTNADGAKDASGARLSISYVRWDQKLNAPIFHRVPAATCPYGYSYGKKQNGHYQQSCRDPFFSLAADSHAHSVGEVIFVPKLVGLRLPSGEIHDGYLVIRDTGADLDDRGQDFYAFFSGLELDNDPKNPFVRQMLDNYDFEFDYQVAAPAKAAAVRKARNFPGLPDSLRKEYYR